jgi:hypothetical protein
MLSILHLASWTTDRQWLLISCATLPVPRHPSCSFAIPTSSIACFFCRSEDDGSLIVNVAGKMPLAPLSLLRCHFHHCVSCQSCELVCYRMSTMIQLSNTVLLPSHGSFFVPYVVHSGPCIFDSPLRTSSTSVISPLLPLCRTRLRSYLFG